MEYVTLFVVGFFAALTPGPDLLYIIRRSVCDGRLTGMYAVAGILSGNAIYLILVWFGLGILGRSDPFRMIIGWIGGVYLLYVARRLWKEEAALSLTCDRGGAGHVFKEAMGITLSNPKAMLFFSTVVAPFMTDRFLFGLAVLFGAISMAFVGTVCIVSRFRVDDVWFGRVNRFTAILFLFFACILFDFAYDVYKATRTF